MAGNTPGPDKLLTHDMIARNLAQMYNDASDKREPYTGDEIADYIGCYKNENLMQPLRDLAANGFIERKKPHPRAVVWWVTERQQQEILAEYA